MEVLNKANAVLVSQTRKLLLCFMTELNAGCISDFFDVGHEIAIDAHGGGFLIVCRPCQSLPLRYVMIHR